METQIFPYCIYTMRHSDDLKRAHESGGRDTFEEGKAWVTGRQLVEEAKRRGSRVPIVFSAAERGSGLLYVGFLESVKVDETERGVGKTIYTFRDLRPVVEEPPKSTLVLKSTGERLSEQYIRPYAICETPAFVSA